MNKITNDILKQVYQPREPEAKKYDFGILLVIGGGEFYTGSPALAALSAFRAGVGMVNILAPQRAADIIAGFSPNLAAYPLPGLCLNGSHLATLLSFTHSANGVSDGKMAVVVGGGLGRSEETKETVLQYLSRAEVKRAVVDADGIYAVAKGIKAVQDKDFVFTPHLFEFFILTGIDVRNLSFSQKIKAVQEQAKKLGAVIALKGRKDIISDGKETAVNETGTPYLAVGGTGDTLAGICGSLIAQGLEPFLAAQAACFINGRAGEIAAEKLGPSLTAVDLIEAIPEAIAGGEKWDLA